MNRGGNDESPMVHASPDEPGWTRRRSGRGFRHLDDRGRPLAKIHLERVKSLAIPPAWTDVWICPDPNGHLQAVGTDAADRRQYIYHPHWREEQDAEKFERMREFGRRLGRARTTVARHLRSPARSHESVCATAFALLDFGCLRVGGVAYAQEYGSVGLTTLTCGHVRRCGNETTISFNGKAGVEQTIVVDAVEVVDAVDRLRRGRRRGTALLMERESGAGRAITADELNDYVRAVTRMDATAKDFRTWHATVVAAAALSHAGPGDETALREAMAAASELLGNSPEQARTSYVDPRVVDAWHSGHVVPPGVARAPRREARRYRRLELAVLRLLAVQESA